MRKGRDGKGSETEVEVKVEKASKKWELGGSSPVL